MGYLIVLAIIALLAYVRLAPTDPARWHMPVGAAENIDGKGWSARVIKAHPGLLSKLNQAMLSFDRTELIAGSVSEGRLTYMTRSKWFGFPDYTTIEEAEEQIRLYGRLRFGQSDLGVNAKRLERLIAAVQP